AASCAVGMAGTAVGSVADRSNQGAGALLGIGTFFGTFFFAFVGYVVFALWFLAQGKTPGKWLVNIRVVDKTNGSTPGIGLMLVRETFGKMISGFFSGLGYFWAIWDRETQCWHDKIAGTLVVREGAVAAALPVPQRVSEVRTVPSGIPALAPITQPAAAVALSPVASADVSALQIALPQLLFCSGCGAGVVPDSRFCEQCGTALA